MAFGKIGVLGFALAMAAMQEENMITARGEVAKTTATIDPVVNSQSNYDGLKKMIEDYKLIQRGECKKGARKQAMIISKIERFLSVGKIHQCDLV